MPEEKGVGIECVLVGAWSASGNILPRSSQVFPYVRLCLVTESGLCFPKIHLFRVRLMNCLLKDSVF